MREPVVSWPPWSETERRLRERAYTAMNNDPQILLERDAWFDLDADMFHARMIGFDDEIVREAWIRRPEPVILEPIVRPFSLARADPTEIAPGVHRLHGVDIHLPLDDDDLLYGRTARYHLQSGFVVFTVDAKYQPPAEPRPDMTVKIAFLRYRRRA